MNAEGCVNAPRYNDAFWLGMAVEGHACHVGRGKELVARRGRNMVTVNASTCSFNTLNEQTSRFWAFCNLTVSI